MARETQMRGCWMVEDHFRDARRPDSKESVGHYNNFDFYFEQDRKPSAGFE